MATRVRQECQKSKSKSDVVITNVVITQNQNKKQGDILNRLSKAKSALLSINRHFL